MKKFLLLLVMIGILTFSNQAQAATIVDTGAGSASLASGSMLDGEDHQSNAAKFSLAQRYFLTDIYGWMGLEPDYTSGNPTISIYGDAGETPNNAPSIYSLSFSIASSTIGWYGLSGLSWDLPSGNYWIAFEPGINQLGAVMPGSSITPLDNEAFLNSITSGAWNADDDINLGIRILGNPAAIPEPATMSLLGLGLMGLMGFKKRK